MSVDKFRKQLAGALGMPAPKNGEIYYLLRQRTDAILDLELLPGITLKRVVELKDKLRVQDDDQTHPRNYTAHERDAHPDGALILGAIKDKYRRAGFRRVSPLGRKE